MLSFYFLWAALSLGQGSTLNTAPAQPVSAGKPVPGSKVLLTTYAIKENSASSFIAKKFIELEKSVGDYEKLDAAGKRKADQEIRTIVSSILDLDLLGRRAMLAYWDKVAALKQGQEQLDSYLKLFKELVEENYLEKARTYVSGKYQISLVEEEKQGEFTYVRGNIRKQDVDLELEFKIRPDAESFKIVDVKLDETSLESTYRSSFNRIIRGKDGLQEGFAELLRVMKVRLEELRKGEATRL